MQPTGTTEGNRGAGHKFLAGEGEMQPTGMQFISQVQRTNPPLHPQLRVMPQWLRAGTPPNLAVMNLAVPRASPHPALAMRLAQFLANTENQLALVRRVPVLPSTRDSYEDADFARPSGDLLLDEARRISTQQVFEGAVQVPPLRHYGKLRASFVRQLQLAMTGRSSAQQAVAEISRVWVPLLGCRA